MYNYFNSKDKKERDTMYNTLIFIRICIYIITLVIFISTISTKNKNILKNNITTSVFMILYLILNFILINYIFEDSTRWDFLVIYFFSVISIILLITTVIISKKKLSKNNKLIQKSPLFIKHYSKLVVLPLIIIICSFLNQMRIINNAQLLLIFEYQNGIIQHDITQVAINRNSSKSFDLKKNLINKNMKKLNQITYYYEVTETGEFILTNSYDDPELKKADIVLFEKIYKEHNLVSNNDSKENNNEIFIDGTITVLEGTEYYIIKQYWGKEKYGVSQSDGEAIFYKDKYFSKFNSDGDLTEVYLLNNQTKDNTKIDNNNETIKSFEATIIEAKEDYIIVRPDEGTTELKSSDKIRIKITRPTSGINDFYVAGNKIIITYNGNINESYPAQIEAIKIKLKS